MIDDTGAQVKEAGLSTPVLIMGWDDVPDAGERFEAVGAARERPLRLLGDPALKLR